VTLHDRDHDIRHHFDDDLDSIRTGLVEMGSLVVENTTRAGDAIIENRLDLVDPVRQADEEINDLYRVLETRTFEILALQQPVATDLRFLVATSRMLYEIERSGDLAVNMVNCLAREGGFPDSPRLTGALSRLVIESCAVFAQGVEAIADMNPAIGLEIDAADDVVDDLTGEYFTLVHDESDFLGLDAAVQLNRIGRFLERIADHGVNIAQHVTFVVTAHFPDEDNPTLVDEASDEEVAGG
jgi:phosphate transport system protein